MKSEGAGTNRTKECQGRATQAEHDTCAVYIKLLRWPTYVRAEVASVRN